MSILCDVNYSASVVGDFNFPIINWAQDFNVCDLPDLESEFVHLFLNFGFVELIKECTRGENILDLLFVNDPLVVSDVVVQSPFSTSDHNSLSWHTLFSKVYPIDSGPIFDFKKANYDMLTNYFNGIGWLQLFTQVAPSDVDGLWEVFKKTIFDAINLYVPRRRIINRPSAKSYPSYIQRAIKRKCALWRTCRHSDKAAYKAQANLCQRLIRRYRGNQERHLLENNNNFAAFYKNARSKLSFPLSNAPLLVKNNYLIDDNTKAEDFNQFFSSIFTRPDIGLPDTSLPISSSAHTSDPIKLSLEITYNALRSAKATYSSGPDDIPSVFWVNLASSLAMPISIIFTSSYQFATLPQEWREATVFPLFKKGDPSSVSNYRPISLTCTLCKVMESIIKDSLLSFAQANNIFSPCQHGFIPGKSTCTHLLESHFDWCSGLEKKNFLTR